MKRKVIKFISAPPLYTAHRGWCVKEGNIDQNDGDIIISLNMSPEVCLRRCLAYTEATGCEVSISGTCTVHTQPIVGGNGNRNYTCWVFHRQSRFDFLVSLVTSVAMLLACKLCTIWH